MNLKGESKVSMPLKSLIAGVSFTCVAAFTLTQIYGRLNTLEVEVAKNTEWVETFEPPAEVQSAVERLRELELKFAALRQCNYEKSNRR
jgi:hypothetical protein